MGEIVRHLIGVIALKNDEFFFYQFFNVLPYIVVFYTNFKVMIDRHFRSQK